MPDPMLYKIMPAALWASAADAMPWAPVDVADGFVHLSSASQVRETARRHFAGQRDLVLLEVDPSALPEGALRWEVSRGGALFPHVYGDVPVAAIVRVTPLTADEHGFAFPRRDPVIAARWRPRLRCAPCRGRLPGRGEARGPSLGRSCPRSSPRIRACSSRCSSRNRRDDLVEEGVDLHLSAALADGAAR